MDSLKIVNLHVALLLEQRWQQLEEQTLILKKHRMRVSAVNLFFFLTFQVLHIDVIMILTGQCSMFRSCFNLTGYPPESLLYNRDLSYNELISPEYHDVLWNEWERVLAAGQPFKYEYEIITAAGEKKWVLEMGQGIYNDAGEVEALEGIVFDISDRKAIEDALKYNYEHDRWTGLHNHDYLVALLHWY